MKMIYGEGHTSQKCWHDFTDIFTTRPSICYVALLAKILQCLKKAMIDSHNCYFQINCRRSRPDVFFRKVAMGYGNGTLV